MKVSDVMQDAIRLGACSQSGKATDWKSLCWLFFTPQGREFCENNNFPSLEMFQKMKPHVAAYGVFVDAGMISMKNNANVGIIGKTEAMIEYDDNTKLHRIILMHGARAVIKVSNYAVVNVINVGNCPIEVINDGTGKVL